MPDEIAPFVQSINRLLERINRLMGQQRRFIADAAHELRTPLTALSLQAQNLERADSLAACKERLLPLKTGLERSRHLLDQLLGLARQQASTGNLQQVNLVDIAQTVLEEVFPLAEMKRIDLGVEQQGKVLIDADVSAIHMLLRNAVDNALLYTSEGGEVTVHVHSDGDEASWRSSTTAPAFQRRNGNAYLTRFTVCLGARVAEAAWGWRSCVISPNVWVEPSDSKIDRTRRD